MVSLRMFGTLSCKPRKTLSTRMLDIIGGHVFTDGSGGTETKTPTSTDAVMAWLDLTRQISIREGLGSLAVIALQLCARLHSKLHVCGQRSCQRKTEELSACLLVEFWSLGVLHDSPRAQTCTFQGSGASETPPKFHERTPQEGKKRTKWSRERKKERKFGRSSGGREGARRVGALKGGDLNPKGGHLGLERVQVFRV